MGLKSVFLSARPIVLSLARSTMPSSTTLFSNKRQRLGDGGRAEEAHRLHGEVGSAIAASLADPTQEVPTGAAHPNLALFCRVSSVAAPAPAKLWLHRAT